MNINDLTERARKLAQEDAAELARHFEKADRYYERRAAEFEAFVIARAVEMLQAARESGTVPSAPMEAKAS